MCGLLDNEDVHNCYHPETRECEIARSEQAVDRVMTAIKGFLNPFKAPDKDNLIIISSGSKVPPAVEVDVLRAEEAGSQERKKFMRSKLSPDATIPFFHELTKQKLLKMDSCNKRVKLSLKDGKIVQYQEQGKNAFQMLVKAQSLAVPLSMEEIMTYSLTPVPHALGTPDGFMAKTEKSKLMIKIASDFQTSMLQDIRTPKNIIYL